VWTTSDRPRHRRSRFRSSHGPGVSSRPTEPVGPRPRAAGERSAGGDARSLRIALACWTADVCRAAAAWGAGVGGAVDSCGDGLRSCRLTRERRRFECLLRPVPALAVGSDAPGSITGPPTSLTATSTRNGRLTAVSSSTSARRAHQWRSRRRPRRSPVRNARSSERDGLVELTEFFVAPDSRVAGCRSRVARHRCASDREDRRQHGGPLTGGERLMFGQAINGRSPN
jgi:hypothetical protein